MNIQSVERSLKERALSSYSLTGCDYVDFKRYPGLRFMIEDGVVTRADAGKRIKNSAGVTEGMTLKKVRSLYPSVQIEPHQYDDDGFYYILKTKGGKAAIVMETGKDTVTDIRAGLEPSVEYVEGCL